MTIMQDLSSRIRNYFKIRINYLFCPVNQIFDYTSIEFMDDSKEKRILDELNPSKYQENLIFTTYFCSKPDRQKKEVIESDNFEYIKKFYESVKSHNLHAVIFYDNLSDDFIRRYNCRNVKFVKSRVIKYSLNDERFLIYSEFLDQVKPQKIILSDGNDVIFGKNPFEFIKDSKFYIGRDHYCLNKHSEWIQMKINILPKEVRENIPSLFYEMPLVNAGVLGGNYATLVDFLKKVVILIRFVDNDQNHNMAIVNIVFFDSFWIDYNTSWITKVKFLITKDRNKLAVQPTIYNDKFHLGKPFTSHFFKFEKDNGSYIYHK